MEEIDDEDEEDDDDWNDVDDGDTVTRELIYLRRRFNDGKT